MRCRCSCCKRVLGLDRFRSPREGREGGHRRSDPDQEFGARKARASIDAELGGESGEDDGYRSASPPGRRPPQPVVQEGEGAFDAEGDEDERAAGAGQPDLAELGRAFRAAIKPPTSGKSPEQHRTGR